MVIPHNSCSLFSEIIEVLELYFHYHDELLISYLGTCIGG